MDALSDILRLVRLAGGVYLQAEFTAPWCLEGKLRPHHIGPMLHSSEHVIIYHYVLEGSVWVKIRDLQPRLYEAGEVIIMPHNDLHKLGSNLDVTPGSKSDIVETPHRLGLARMEYGGGGEATKLICGYLGCDKLEASPLIASLPPTLSFDARKGEAADWIKTSFHFAAEEVANGKPGGDAILARISELLFVEAVRRYVESLPEDEKGWLAGLRDAQVSKALALMHADCAYGWTVEKLAAECALSRSAFAEKFARIIGETPMQYFGHWRLQVADRYLKDEQNSIAQIAADVGFGSEAAFSRAYKKHFGASPSSRRRKREIEE